MTADERPAGSPGPHRHTWPEITFSMDDGHPWMTMRCPCGTERRIRAYERFWHPDTDARDDAGVAGRPGTDGVETGEG